MQKGKSFLFHTCNAMVLAVTAFAIFSSIYIGSVLSVDHTIIIKAFSDYHTQAVAAPTTDQIKHNFHVVIDAGHGGFDGGVQGSAGTRESELALTISHALKDELETKGITVTMTREDDERLHDENARHKQRSDILNRHKIIEQANPDLVISIHLNSFPGDRSVSGLQVFYDNKSRSEPRDTQTSKNFAHAIQNHLNKTQLFRGTATRGKDSRPGNYLILETPFPSVLIECGFLSNPTEEQKLLTPDYQKLLATHITNAILETLNTGENYPFV